MQIHTSDNPAREAGTHLSRSIETHDGDVLCLLSGGSALNVIEHIKVTDRPECRTIFIMGDERVSGEESVNNYLQLATRYPLHPVTTRTVDTAGLKNETVEEFAERVAEIFFEIISETKNLKTISLQGMGEDGHTAGIFPLDSGSFQETYRRDATYVPVHVEGLTIDSRASVTPAFLQNHVDELIGFVTGEGKKMMLESLLSESKELHERPAEIFKSHKDVNLFTDLSVMP